MLALALALFSSLAAVPAVAARSCLHPAGTLPGRLQRVIDGDTIALADGRHVRVIGINTPELPHGRRPEEPGARAAQRFAREFLGDGRLTLLTGAEPADRYGRTLAYVYRADGASLAEALAGAGLGMLIAIPPNLAEVDCLARAEAAARAAGRGLWRDPAWAAVPVATLVPDRSGFLRLRGTVGSQRRTRANWWMTLDDRVALRIAAADLPRFDEKALRELAGREIVVRGWLQRRKTRGEEAPWTMQLSHPAVIELPASARGQTSAASH